MTIRTWLKDVTNGELMGPAMSITDPDEAKDYFESLVLFYMGSCGWSREEATINTLSNLGYWSGYYDQETMRRVEQVFGAKHPIYKYAILYPKELGSGDV
jgi:hypothetical protein